MMLGTRAAMSNDTITSFGAYLMDYAPFLYFLPATWLLLKSLKGNSVSLITLPLILSAPVATLAFAFCVLFSSENSLLHSGIMVVDLYLHLPWTFSCLLFVFGMSAAVAFSSRRLRNVKSSPLATATAVALFAFPYAALFIYQRSGAGH